MKHPAMLSLLLALLGTAATPPTWAQRPDYLTPAEVEKAREIREPNERIQLFLGFAVDRLAKFDQAVQAQSSSPSPDQELLFDRLDDYIRAIDDTAAVLEFPLERGGADLHKTRPKVEKQVEEFLARLKLAQDRFGQADSELRYELEEAVMATEDLLELAKTIPGDAIPPQQPEVVAGESEKPPPGRPTLKPREKKEPPR